MKTRKKTNGRLLSSMALFLLLSLMTTNVPAQVTIGIQENPASGALLQLKDISGVTDDGKNANRGFELPRVSLTHLNNLYPMFLNDPANPASGSNADYSANKATLDKTHKGLVVYNINTADPFLQGIYFWDGTQWENLSSSTEPWQVAGTTNAATQNTQNIYQMGQVAVGSPDTIQSITQFDVVANNRGIMIPRLTETQRDAIPVNDYANSLLIYNTTEDCYNYYSRMEAEWQSLCGKEGKAVFAVDCGSIQVYGIYGDGVALNTSNYLRITVNVSKIGSYSIAAVASPDNGYFYETSGVFYSLGTFTLTVPGTGQPVNHTQGLDLLNPGDDTPDQFTLSSSGGGSDCNFIVNVNSTAARPEYEIDCRATAVEGRYFEDEALTSAPPNGPHRLKVTLTNIPPTAYGSIAMLETNTVDGFSFKGEAVLMSSTQDIYLIGTGIPRGLNDKLFTITSNSESSSASCQVVVRMLIPPKRLMTLGVQSEYGYNPGQVSGRIPPNGLNTLLTDKDNFGYNQWSILRFAGFNNLGGATANFIPTSPNAWIDDGRDIVALETSTWQNMSTAKLTELLYGTAARPPIDVFMIGYSTEFFRNSNADDLARNTIVVNWVKQGGILMICSEATASNGNFMNLFFHGTTSPGSALLIGSATGAGAGARYTIGFNTDNMPADMRPYYCRDDDPILRGPFDDILGRTWGEDASNTRYVTNLPLDEVVIYSGAREIGNTSRPDDGVTIFRHREYPFIFIGDGGFNSHQVRGYSGSATICPFTLTVKTINGHTYNNYPHYRTNYGSGGSSNRESVYNALFSANAFAWCIMKAEELRRTP